MHKTDTYLETGAHITTLTCRITQQIRLIVRLCIDDVGTEKKDRNVQVNDRLVSIGCPPLLEV